MALIAVVALIAVGVVLVMPGKSGIGNAWQNYHGTGGDHHQPEPEVVPTFNFSMGSELSWRCCWFGFFSPLLFLRLLVCLVCRFIHLLIFVDLCFVLLSRSFSPFV